MPPPLLPKAVLLVKALLCTVAVPKLLRPPPCTTAVLPAKVLPLTVAVPPFSLARPPPNEPAVLLVQVLPRTVAVPPLSLARPPPLVAELLEKTLLLTVNVPKLSRPPPFSLPALPPAIVRPEIFTVSPASTVKMREVLLPLTVSLSAPGPVIVRSCVMVGSSVPFRRMVPVTWKLMLSAPAWVLAWVMAVRSEPATPSIRVVTCCQHEAVLQLFQGQASKDGALAGPPRGASMALG